LKCWAQLLYYWRNIIINLNSEFVILIYWIIFAIVFLYHAYTIIGLGIFALHAFKFAKIIKFYSNVSFDYNQIIQSFAQNGFKYNNTLYKKNNITLIRPDVDWFSHRNGIFKFRLSINNLSNNEFDIIIYSDRISKYLIFLFIYFLPFIFTFALIFDKPLNIGNFMPAIVIFVLLFIPFFTLSLFIQRHLRSRFITKIENIIFSRQIATAPNKA